MTVVEAPTLPAAALDVASARLGSLLPTRAFATGVLILGDGDRVTLARAIDLDDDVVRRVLAVRVQVPDRRHRGWLPHLTLARRVPRHLLPQAMEVVGSGHVELTFTELRRWDPDLGRVTRL
jgi:hypothetical protein